MHKFSDLQEKYPDKVRAVLNIMVETPYFYREDDEELFAFLRRYREEFDDFYQTFFGWVLIFDNKCARVYKDRWYNENIPPSCRMQFNFSKRDECIAFMLLLEFFEHQLEEQSMSADDPVNLRFRFGALLSFCHQRFQELFENQKEKYTEEYLRSAVLRPVMPKLIQFRFLKELPRPQNMNLGRDDTIYEAMPALYHYNAGRLTKRLDIDNVDDTENNARIPDENDGSALTDDAGTELSNDDPAESSAPDIFSESPEKTDAENV